MGSEIIKGRNLMLFNTKGEGSDAYTDRLTAFATSHTLNLTGETINVDTKDHSIFDNEEFGKYNWELTTEGLYIQEDFDSLFDAMISGKSFVVVFGIKAEDDSLGQNIVDGDYDTYTYDINYYSGKVIITSLVANAQNGENATNSITLTGVGKLEPTFDWKDVTDDLIKNPKMTISEGKITDWTFNEGSISSIDGSNYYSYENYNYAVWRNNGTDKSIYQEIVIPYTGLYKLSANFYSTYESNLSLQRVYGDCNMMYRDDSGEMVIAKLVDSVENGSIFRGKSLSALSNGDLVQEVDGTTYYFPSCTYPTSVSAYFQNRYKLSKTVRLKAGQVLKIKIGQTWGGSKTNVVIGNLKLEYKYK